MSIMMISSSLSKITKIHMIATGSIAWPTLQSSGFKSIRGGWRVAGGTWRAQIGFTKKSSWCHITDENPLINIIEVQGRWIKDGKETISLNLSEQIQRFLLWLPTCCGTCNPNSGWMLPCFSHALFFTTFTSHITLIIWILARANDSVIPILCQILGN